MDRVQQLINEEVPFNDIIGNLTERGLVEWNAAVDRVRQVRFARRIAELEQVLAAATDPAATTVQHRAPDPTSVGEPADAVDGGAAPAEPVEPPMVEAAQ